MAVKWMRLDVDFWHDPKIVLLRRNKSDATAFKAIQLYCLATSRNGQIDITDPIERTWVESELSISSKKLDNLLNTLAEHQIIDADDLQQGVVTCGRLRSEAIRIEGIKERRSKAAKKRWESDANA